MIHFLCVCVSSGDHVLKLGSKYGNIRAVMEPVKKEGGEYIYRQWNITKL